jgi:hypothetical protein
MNCFMHGIKVTTKLFEIVQIRKCYMYLYDVEFVQGKGFKIVISEDLLRTPSSLVNLL